MVLKRNEIVLNVESALLRINGMASGKSFQLSEPQLLHLSNT